MSKEHQQSGIPHNFHDEMEYYAKSLRSLSSSQLSVHAQGALGEDYEEIAKSMKRIEAQYKFFNGLGQHVSEWHNQSLGRPIVKPDKAKNISSVIGYLLPIPSFDKTDQNRYLAVLRKEAETQVYVLSTDTKPGSLQKFYKNFIVTNGIIQMPSDNPYDGFEVEMNRKGARIELSNNNPDDFDKLEGEVIKTLNQVSYDKAQRYDDKKKLRIQGEVTIFRCELDEYDDTMASLEERISDPHSQ